MSRLTQRDEYGNAEIITLSDTMPEIYAGLSFSETNALTNALNKLADYEDKEEQSPKSDVQKVKHGKWIEKHYEGGIFDGSNLDECSVCGYERFLDIKYKTIYKFCPECGAKMDKR